MVIMSGLEFLTFWGVFLGVKKILRTQGRKENIRLFNKILSKMTLLSSQLSHFHDFVSFKRSKIFWKVKMFNIHMCIYKNIDFYVLHYCTYCAINEWCDFTTLCNLQFLNLQEYWLCILTTATTTAKWHLKLLIAWLHHKLQWIDDVMIYFTMFCNMWLWIYRNIPICYQNQIEGVYVTTQHMSVTGSQIQSKICPMKWHRAFNQCAMMQGY